MKLKEKWTNLNGRQKQVAVIGSVAGVAALTFIVSGFNDYRSGVLARKKPNTETQIITSASRDLTMERLAGELQSMRQEWQNEKRNKAAGGQGGMTAEEVLRLIQDSKQTDLSVGQQGSPFDGQESANTQASLASGTATIPGTLPDGDGLEEKAEKPKSRFQTTNAASPAASDSSDNGKSNTKAAQAGEGENRTYLPAGSILSVALLSGINAPTNASASGNQKDPMPVLMTVKGTALLPNGFRQDLSNCFVLASAFGQYMDSRAMMRTQTLSCVRDDGKSVEISLAGTVMGEDGKPGFQGRVVSKTGKVISQLVKIGAMETLADIATGVANGVNINTGSGSNEGSPRTQINLGGTAAEAAGKRTSKTFDRIADIYSSYGTQAIPVVEVEPLRTGEIIVTKGVFLDYVKKDQRK